MKTPTLVSFLAAGMLFASTVFASETDECYKASCDFEAEDQTEAPARAGDFHEQLALWIEALHANCNLPGPEFDRELARRLEALGANCDQPGPELLAQLVALVQSGR